MSHPGMNGSFASGGDDAEDADADLAELLGTPLRVSEWLLFPLIVVIVGVGADIAYLILQNPLAVGGWIAIVGGLVFVLVGVYLAIRGHRAYARATLADTEIWRREELTGVWTLALTLMVVGLLTGAGELVLMGLFIPLFGLRIRYAQHPGELARHFWRLFAIQAAVLFVVTGVTVLIRFTDNIPTQLSTRYIGGGFIYLSLAAGTLIYFVTPNGRERLRAHPLEPTR